MEKKFILKYKNQLNRISGQQSKTFSAKIPGLLSLFVLYGSMSVAQPFSVTVNTNAIPPVNPLISQYVSSGNVNSTLLYTNAFGGSIQVVVYGKIERLSPSPFTLSVNAVYLPQPPITLTAGVPAQLSATDRLNAFGFFNDNNLSVSGIALTDLKDANNNIKLPDGVYRICFYARQFDPASGQLGNFVSDQNLGCGNFTIAVQSVGNVVITTVVTPPVPDLLLKAIDNSRIKVSALYNNPAGGNTQVKLFGKVECLSPAPFTVSLNPNYQLQQPVSLTSSLPVQLTPNQIKDAFGNFNDINLVISGISLSALKDANNNLKLPDGIYRICFYARYFSPTGLGNNASDVNLGCGTFTVCGKAAAPQFTQPVSNFNINNSEMVTVQKVSPVVFSWTPPNSTCGLNISNINYDFEIREILPSQTVTDAINNPPVFTKYQLPSSTFLFDTLLNKNILESGKQYVIRVKANTLPNSEAQIDNNGYSRIEAFQYGEKKNNSNGGNPPPPPKDDGNPPKKGDEPPAPSGNPSVDAEGGDCGLTTPSNTTLVAANETFKNKEIKIGEFKLVPGKMNRNNDGSYTGDGTIDWIPLASISVNNVASPGVAKLKVAFDKIKINSTYEVFDGQIVTQTDPGVFKNESFNQLKDFAKKNGAQLDKLAGDVEGFINTNPAARLISNLTGNTPVDLPLGLNNQDIGGVPVTLAIMNILFSPKGATMSVLFDMNIPEASGWLTLAGNNFCIHPKGLSLTKGTLFLPTDRDFNIGSGKEAFNIKFKGCPTADSAKGTYVNWENSKLTDIVAHAEISFPQNAFVPEDDKGEITGGSVTAKILFRFKEWEDWVATIDMPHFQIKDVKGLSFQPSTIYYDHSVKSNPSGFTYPSNAKVKKGNDFEGLYIEEFKVLLPDDFKTFNQKKEERTEFTAKNLILDDNGLTVYIQGKNVIDIKTGDMGGWGYSLTNIELQITGTVFEKGKMEGQFLLPVSKTPLDYTGDLHLGKDSVNYAFVIKPSAKMNWDIWMASVELKPNSYIEVKKDSLGAAVTALMYGDVSIILSGGTPSLKFEAIKFDSLGISNRNIKTKKKEFWMSPGNWAFASPQKSVGGFPVSLGGITPYVDMKSEIEAGLRFKLSIGIGGGDKTVIGAEAKLAVYGKIKFSLDDFRPNFTVTGGVSADSVRLFGDAGPVKVDGYLAFYKKDNVYGDGIKGHVKATFPLVEIEATAQFGEVNNFNYWYIDACAQFSQPIPIIGFLGINGFGGGAYSNMKLQNDPPKTDEMKAKSIANNSTPGSSMSGISFVPSEGSFGLRATVFVCMTSGAGPKAMNAKITMGAEIANGAFQKLTLTGDVYVFTNPPKNDRAIVNGHVDIIYDIPAEKFSLNALVVANFSAAKLTVPINLYTGPDGWYFKVGDPWAQKVTLDFPESKTAFYHYKIGASAYFVVGSLINPQFPDLPVQVTNMLGVTADPKIQSFINELNKTPGSGMMFGAEVHGNLGFNVAIIYADAEAIVGFDMMLKNFDNLTCNGGTSAGWENWYALGQLYAYLKLDVGLNIDVWFYSGKVSLAKFEAGAYLRGGLPNPTWMDGAVAIKGEVLGGLIKVQTEAHFSIGDKCYPDPDPLKDIKIISDYGPKGNKESVFVYPFGASNVGLEKNYEITLPPTQKYPDGEVRLYQFKIKSFRLLKGGTVPVESAGLEYSPDNSSVTLKRNKILDEYANYTGEIQCYAIQYYEGKGWRQPWNDKLSKEEAVEETSTFTFKTGPKPDYIPDENISFSYPVNKQRYVLKSEMGGKGKIHLDQEQDNILIGDGTGINAMKSYKLYFIPVGSTDTIKTNFTWNDNTRDIEYIIPAALKNSTAYKLELWSFEKSSLTMGLSASSVLKTESKMNATNVKGVETKQTSVVSAALKIPKPIYTMYYRTSEYNTLTDKLNAMGDWGSVKKSNALYITNDAMTTEHFDEFETKGFTAPNGKNYYPPLVNINIAWDNKQQNDRFAEENLYVNSFSLAFKNVKTDYGVNWIREVAIAKPVKTVDLNRLFSDKPLSTSETGEPVPPSNTPKSISGGYSMKLPVSNANKNQSAFSPFGYQTIVWDREKYLIADHQLMKDFANSVAWNAGAFSNWSAAYTQNYLDKLGGNADFASNSLGGYVTMPWNKFYYLYTDAKYMSIINKLKSLPFTAYPKGNRTMQWMYKAGSMQGNMINKTFIY
jgi:hypothetical protein